uniref:Uncharacterized protein n=1 Tax=Physcomitrium patens TaxID=3218 RepID=A0A2K1JDY0_PHYPA|nr:hypothetical protein PHYPA_020020 [Physcomitrium patens]
MAAQASQSEQLSIISPRTCSKSHLPCCDVQRSVTYADEISSKSSRIRTKRRCNVVKKAIYAAISTTF